MPRIPLRFMPLVATVLSAAHAGHAAVNSAFSSAPAAASKPLASLAAPSLGGQFVQVTMALGFVLLLIVAVAWLMRRFTMLPMAAGARLRVVSGVMVGAKERVVIVEIEGTWLVLGVTAQSVNKLHELPRPAQDAAPAAQAMPAFAERLARALMRKDAP